MSEIRWYKGKYKVEVVLKSKGNWRVRLLEPIEVKCDYILFKSEKETQGYLKNRAWTFPEGSELTTPHRLLWKHPREKVGE